MKRMQLTDEEARVIEQRRLMEQRESIGYNEALINLLAHIEGFSNTAPWPEVKHHLVTWAMETRRTIRP